MRVFSQCSTSRVMLPHYSLARGTIVNQIQESMLRNYTSYSDA